MGKKSKTRAPNHVDSKRKTVSRTYHGWGIHRFEKRKRIKILSTLPRSDIL